MSDAGLALLPPTYFEAFFLILVRVTTVIMTLPVISSRNVPVIAKIGAAGILAFVLTPTIATSMPAGVASASAGALPFIIAIAQEILLGLIFGFAVQLVFTSIQMAGQLLGIQMGLNIATTIDPITQANQVSYLDQLYALLAGMVFLTINGHHMAIQALAASFTIVPLGQFHLGDAVATDLIALVAQSFTISVRMGLPIAAALLLTDIAFLIIGRTAPQMNIFMVGQPVKIGVGLVAFFLALPTMVSLMTDVFGGLTGELTTLLRAVG